MCSGAAKLSVCVAGGGGTPTRSGALEDWSFLSHPRRAESWTGWQGCPGLCALAIDWEQWAFTWTACPVVECGGHNENPWV